MKSPTPLPVNMFVEIYHTGGLLGLRAALGGVSGEQKIEILKLLESRGFGIDWKIDPNYAWKIMSRTLVAGPDK